MKKILYLALTMAWLNGLSSQTTISGTLKERGVDVVVGANIYLEGAF